MSYIDDKVFQKALENLKNEFDTKVDKDGNKVLSDNNFTNDLKEKLENKVLIEENLKDYVKNSDYATNAVAGVVKIGEGLSIDTNGILNADTYTQEEINELLNGKVDVEEGKSLVDDEEIKRLATLKNYDDTSILQSIQNLEEGKVDKDGNKVLSDNNFTNEFKEKLEKIENEANKYELPEATETVLGGITIGEGLTKDTDKNLTVAAATSEKIGGIKLGETLKIDTNTGKVNVDSEKVAETFATKEYVDNAIDELPNPMIFQGSVGDGGTVPALPEINENNIGWTYKAISDGDNYKVGDTLISNGTEWVVIPSGDEPDGTVTNVGLSVPAGFKVKGSPITSSGNLEFEFDEGYELPTIEKLNSYQVKKLITEWSNEASDENYPSEKLVKDSLDKKVDDDSYATTEKAGIVQVGKGLEITESGLLNITGLETVAISKREYDEEDRSVDNIVYFIEDIDNYPGGTDINFSFSAEQLEALNSGITGLDKAKLEGIEYNANKYVLPTASKNTVGGVTTTSEIEDNEGYVACPIIDGVPYYKEDNIMDGGNGFVLEKAEADKLGGVMIGNNITIDNNGKISVADPYTLEKATTTTLGGIIIGSNLTIDDNGVLSAAAPYTLGKASKTSLGGIIVGDNLTIDDDGVLSTTNNTYENATTTTSGLMSANDKIKLNNLAYGRKSGTKVGTNSIAAGYQTTASGEYSTSVGYQTTAIGDYSYAEGKSINIYTYIPNLDSSTNIDDIVAAWEMEKSENFKFSLASGRSSHVEGNGCLALSYEAHAEGFETLSRGISSHSEGNRTQALAQNAHAEGQSTIASGNQSHSEGSVSEATGHSAHAEGYDTKAKGDYSHAEGNISLAYGKSSHAEGYNTYAKGNYSHAGGYYTEADNFQTAVGRFNDSLQAPTDEYDTTGFIFVVGNGCKVGSATIVSSNGFKIAMDGNCYAAKAFNANGADYAEYFEWEDGNISNEDRRGYFVTLKNNKIAFANSNDYILGIVSSDYSYVGDVYDDSWIGMYKKDVFGKIITETVEVPESTDENGQIIPAHTRTTPVINTDYNPELEYVGRDKRSEWSPVGLLGKLVVIDDGTCEEGSFCKVADGGTATSSDTGYYVMERLDDNHIKILYR